MRTWLLGAALVLVSAVAVADSNYGLIEMIHNGATTQAVNANGYYIENAASSATNPTLAPNQTDKTAGMGGTGGDVSIITGGNERINIDTAGTITCDEIWNQTSTWFAADGVQVQLGTGNDFRMLYQTADTPDTTVFAVSADSRGLVLCEVPDLAFDFAHALQSNPTLFGHSSNQSTSEWWSLTHDATNMVISTGAGDVSMTPAGGDVTVAGRVASPPASLISLDGATAIAITRNVHTVDCVGAETITTATGGSLGMMLTLIFETDADVCTLTDTAAATADTFNLSAAFTSTTNDTISFVHDGTKWLETGRGVN